MTSPDELTTPPSGADTTILLVVTRLEAKLDVALTKHAAEIEQLGREQRRHEDTLRRLDTKVDDLDERLSSDARSTTRAVDVRLDDIHDRLVATTSIAERAITWKVLGATFLGFSGALATVLTILEPFLR